MLHGPAARAATGFNPYYGLVVRDLGRIVPIDAEDYIDVLWEDGVERRHRRVDLLTYEDARVMYPGF